MEINEAELKDYPKPIFYESTKKILEQMSKNICKINIDGKRGTGFLTKIPVNDKLIRVFITNYHVINKQYLDKKNVIEVDLFNDESKIITIENKVIYYNEKYDVTMIEIDEKKDGKYEYLELDDNILNKNKIKEYIGNSMYILHYPSYYEKQKLAVSYGIIKNKFEDKEYDFIHYCSTEKGSSGSPILNINNNKVIGIHKRRNDNRNYNIGSFLYYSIKEFIDKYKEVNNNKKKEINNRYNNLGNYYPSPHALNSALHLGFNAKKIMTEEEKEQYIFIKGDIIHNTYELEMIARKISKKKIILVLLYKATVDSDKAEAFHIKCDDANSTIVLVETDKGKRFGGFTSCSWSGNCLDKLDQKAFVFSFDKMKIYDNIPGEEAIGCYPNYGPVFLGCQIRIYDNAFTKGGTTFEKGVGYYTREDYELTDGERAFKVKEIEVYEVTFE